MIPKVNFLKECIAKITKDFKINVTKLLPELLENLIEYFLLICNDIERIMSGVDNIISVAKLMLETEQKSMIEQLKGARKSLTTVVDKHLLLLIDKQSDLILLPNFDIESQIEVNKFHQNIDWLNEECKVNKKNVCNICCLFYNFCSGDMINQFENVDQLSQLIDDANQMINLISYLSSYSGMAHIELKHMLSVHKLKYYSYGIL